jgi:hypothetical protein
MAAQRDDPVGAEPAGGQDGGQPDRAVADDRHDVAAPHLRRTPPLTAYVRNGRLDILTANQLGKAVYAPVFSTQTQAPNMARFIFLSPGAREFFVTWEGIASDAVAILRAEAGRNPYDRRLSDLIGELSTRSDEFRVRWAAHNVKFHRTGSKQLHHPIVGDLTLAYEALELPADLGQRILVYTAEPASPSDDALKLLATWSATTPLTEPHADAAH